MRNFIFLMMVFLSSCSDMTVELGNGYWLRIEGGELNEIFHRGITDKKGIPPGINRYAYNQDFILAEQNPRNIDDILHEDDIITYNFGRDTLYYWVIVKSTGSRYGPLTKSEFSIYKHKFNVPEKLELESIY